MDYELEEVAAEDPKPYKCSYCLGQVFGDEYWENCFAHADCVVEEQKFKLRSTSTPWRDDE